MTQREEQEPAAPAIPPVTDEELDAVLHEAKGDTRETIPLQLHHPSFAADANRLVSYGFVRGRAPWSRAG